MSIERPAGQWWSRFFDDAFAEHVLDHVDERQVERTVAFLFERLRLRPGDRVFDQGCGIGRLSRPLARAGARVVGVDLIEGYVQRARAASHGLACEYHCGDAFDFVAPEACDGAVNWYTSFGFATDDARNAAMLQRAFDSLRPGGWFALDYANVPRLLREFAPRIVTRVTSPAGETVIERDSTLALAEGMLVQRWSYARPDGTRHTATGETRLYLPHALVGLLRGAGFDEIALFGGIGGEGFELDSPRCIALARRPEH